MRFLKNISIRQRLTAIIMSVSCISVLLTTFTISVFGVYNLRGKIVNELQVSASIVGALNIASLGFDDYKDTPKYLAVLENKSTVVQACLYDHESILKESLDKEVARYTNPKYSQVHDCPLDVTEHDSMGNDRFELMKPITNGVETVGYIYLESTLEEINKYIEKQTIIALSVALAALVVSYLLAINLQRAISQPILSLADTARQVSLDKDYSIRAPQLGDVIKDDKNELVILTGAFNDMLTEIGARDLQLKKQNVALKKAKDAAESANRAKSQFLANISHELRTPLNAIIGFSSILMNQLFGVLGDQKYLEYAKDINESGTHLLDIINDILDLSKAEAGKLALTYEEVHVGKAVNKCVTIIAERAEKSKITITTDVPKMLPALVADRLRLIQIILNILSNAVKFTGEGGKVHIAVRTEQNEAGITIFTIAIQDTGIGMSKEDLEKAFQSFGQVDSGLNRKYEGTGLGLPLTKKLVDLHYGTIKLESELGKGTLVLLTFPAIPPAEAGYAPEA